MDITGASALVTGGASGLGLATARRLAAAGAAVTIIDLPDLGGLRRRGRARRHLRRRRCHRAPSRSPPRCGPPRHPVPCASSSTAPASPRRPRCSTATATRRRSTAFERIIRVNLIGTYNVIAQASAVMARTEPDADSGDRGVIVNTASVAAFDGQIGQPAYSASKGGVHAMTLPIARELARYGIRVVTIAPGIMETPMLAGLPQAAQDSLGEQVPYPQRLGRPDEYARLVMSIVDNGYLNGETIRLDGAIRMAPK